MIGACFSSQNPLVSLATDKTSAGGIGVKRSTAQTVRGVVAALGAVVMGGLVAGPVPAEEVLPWANAPKTPAPAPVGGDSAALDAAAAQCSSLFEAACRDLKTCAWVADVKLEDGTLVPARCVARPPAPPKTAKKKPQQPAKPKETATAPAAPAAPAVKASIQRAPEAENGSAEPEKAAPSQEAKAPEPGPGVVTEPAGKPKETASEPAEKKKEKTTEAATVPIVVAPPKKPEPEKPETPSFGSISPIMPGGSNAVVVTVPPQD